MGFLSKLLGRNAPEVASASVTDEARLREIVVKEAGHFLEDIEWRYKQTRDMLNELSAPAAPGVFRKVTAEDFNVLQHQLTGYTVTDNMNASGVATPGSIRWQQLHIVYAGVDYTIADGASSLRYHSFVKPASGTTASLVSSDTKPTLGKDDLLVFINNAGVATVPAQGQGSLPTAVADGTVDNGALADNAVSGTKIANSGIGAGKLGTGAISASTMFGSKVVATAAVADNAIQSAQLNAGAVTAGKIGVGGVSASNQLATKVVDTAAIADTAVGSGQLATGAVTAGKIGTSAINNSNLFTAGVVNDTAVATGAVTPTKLNVLSHTLY